MKFPKIAVVKLSSLGDIIHALPAFNLLKKQYPHSKITWVTEVAGGRLLQNFLTTDEIYIINFKGKNIAKKFKEAGRILKKQRRKFDLVIDFQGLIKSSILSFLIGKKRLGFHSKNLKEPVSSMFYSIQAELFDEKQHVIFKNISLLKPIGIEKNGISYNLREAEPGRTLSGFIDSKKIKPRNYIVINIGAGWKSKLLTPEQYINMIKELSGTNKIFVLWGNEDEKKRAEYIAKMSGATITPFLDFPDLIYLIKNAKAIISSDSLAMHIGDMVKTPVVGIFGPTSPGRNGPLFTKKLIIHSQVDCSNCYKRYCENMKCLKDPDLKKIGAFIKNLN